MSAAIWFFGAAAAVTVLVWAARWVADRVVLSRFGVHVEDSSGWWTTLSRLREASATGRVGAYTAQAVVAALTRTAATNDQRQALRRYAATSKRD